jgi:hypothetical protein
MAAAAHQRNVLERLPLRSYLAESESSGCCESRENGRLLVIVSPNIPDNRYRSRMTEKLTQTR